ncbi:unnamed protein product [Didymodactylos carnosus]|uniref:BTB domain-containing protein n=1 Tax=Didymodactylos carnosus TaxID=1234261 RepID=A0A814CSF0_9BILA|nr:unnamed protein product [Didymodactylos carnosus]CAF1517421.1 unnamed protein product [Didymodactylos carnosus]CAF3720351.1 unnamed protein product [Didymodactylos carnosus]CAF4304771.1 unnamed protein product [Didymodactylos carnosus]
MATAQTSLDEFFEQHNTLSNIKPFVSELKKELKMMQSKLDWFTHYVEQIDRVHDTIVEVKIQQEEMQHNLINDQQEWSEIQAKLAQTSGKGKVTLNVGGEIFQTTIETLTVEKPSFFTALFSRQWHVEKDEEGSLFIDRDGWLFGHILKYFRTGEIDIQNDDPVLRKDLMIEARYYHLERFAELLAAVPPVIETKRNFINSTILSSDYELKLNEFYGNQNQQWRLIYKASRDGYATANFHDVCDGVKPTMIIVLSKNMCSFGGFTQIAWTKQKKDNTDSNGISVYIEKST